MEIKCNHCGTTDVILEGLDSKHFRFLKSLRKSVANDIHLQIPCKECEKTIKVTLEMMERMGVFE